MVQHWSERNRVVPAAFMLLERDSKVLLMKRGPDAGYCVGYYSLPAGHVDRGESATQSAIRECAEEVGVQVDPADVELAHVSYYEALEGTHERVSFFFRCKRFSGEPTILEPEKCSELKWCDPAALPAKLTPEVKQLFESLSRGQLFAEFGFNTQNTEVNHG